MFLQIKIAQEAIYPNNHTFTNIAVCIVSVLIAVLIFSLLKYKITKVDTISPPTNNPISLSPVIINVSNFDSKKLANDPELMALNRKRQSLYDQRKGL